MDWRFHWKLNNLSLGNIGADIGLLFQVADDMIDYKGSLLVAGKKTGKDKKKGKAKNKWCPNCEYTCHRECPLTNKKKWYWNCNNHCNYYGKWTGGTHPTGQSTQCDQSSCLAVGVGPNTTDAILKELRYMKLRFATDANAFSQMAEEYYNDPKVNLVNDSIPCQLNYVILIGDGAWTHHDRALTRIKDLRTGHETSNCNAVLNGDLDSFIEASLKANI